MTGRKHIRSDTVNYLNHLNTNPDLLKSAPPVAYGRAAWRMKVLTGRISKEEANNEMGSIVRRWEQYHTSKARELGLELDLERFKWEKGTHFTRFPVLE